MPYLLYSHLTDSSAGDSGDFASSRISHLEETAATLCPSAMNQPQTLPCLDVAWNTLVPPQVKSRAKIMSPLALVGGAWGRGWVGGEAGGRVDRVDS